MRGLIDRPLPSLKETLELNLLAARMTNPDARFIGISVNTSALDPEQAKVCCERYANELNLPVVDPLRHGMQPIMDNLCVN